MANPKRSSLSRRSDTRLEQESRGRLLAAGKTLFASLGYEQTSTSAIARQANTSESQLMRHFEGKRGLLGAVFDESWGALNQQIEKTVSTADALTAIETLLATVMAAFDRDRELAFLFLFEGRRIHAGERDLVLSRGYLEFVEFMQSLVRQAQKENVIESELNPKAVCSALIGAAEGMMRDRIIAERSSHPRPFSDQHVRRVFASFLRATSRSGTKGRQTSRRKRRRSRRAR